jgi:tetratricopeptide (TPR) repeat protein
MNKVVFIFFFGILFSTSLLAQTEPDAIALADDDFQNSFYESLLQKGIENYDKAITALEKCNKMQPDNDVVYFEMGKNYLAQKKYKGCRNKNVLPFDFYIEQYNLCIEYDGIQHFKSVKYWGGDKKLFLTQIKDNIRNEYCKNNNINLFRIKYSENTIEKLKKFFRIKKINYLCNLK